MTKKNNKNFKSSTKCWICDNDYVDNVVKVKDHCLINGKQRGSVHRDCNINVKLNLKIPVLFHNLINQAFHLIMQKLNEFNLQINAIPNELEKYTRFTINNKLSFNDSFQFSSSSLDSLVKNFGKDDFKYLS